MQLKPVSFNGTNINDGTNYEAWIVEATNLQPTVQPIFARRAGTWSVYAGKDFIDQTLTIGIKCNGSFNDQFETLNQVFSVEDDTPRQFIVKDISDSDTQYYVYATTRNVSQQYGTTAYYTLAIDNPVWQAVTQTSQTWTITASGQSTDFSNAGNSDAYPVLEITPTSYPGNGYIYQDYIQFLPQSTYKWVNRPIDISQSTDGTHLDTSALVAAGKCRSDGNDFLVFVDGVSVNRWFGVTTDTAFNSTDTHVWINLDVPAKQTLTLKTAIASTDTVTSIQFNVTAANTTALTAMPSSGQLLIDSEEFTYTAKTVTATTLSATVNARSVRNTTAASHSANATVYWLPYDISFVYGSSDATAPETDDTKKPVINLSTSNNSSFVYDAFADDSKLRSGIWSSAIISRTSAIYSVSSIYTGDNNGGDTDPAAVAGMYIGAYQSAGAWKPETSVLGWSRAFPDTVSSVSISYEYYRTYSSFPAGRYLQTSANGTTYVNTKAIVQTTDLASTDIGAWVTGSLASTDITVPAGTIYLRFVFSGSVSALANNDTYFGITGATVGLTNYPQISRRGEQNNFQFNATFTNSTTGQILSINYPLKTSQTLYIDTDPDFPTAKFNGVIVNGAIGLSSVRSDWLKLQAGTNTITYTADYTGNLTVVVKWRTRFIYL